MVGVRARTLGPTGDVVGAEVFPAADICFAVAGKPVGLGMAPVVAVASAAPEPGRSLRCAPWVRPRLRVRISLTTMI